MKKKETLLRWCLRRSGMDNKCSAPREEYLGKQSAVVQNSRI